jgi:GDPmannose 4,6-dehydratase
MKKVLITGALGQDGTILTEMLENEFELYGVCRLLTPIKRLQSHTKKHKIELCLTDLTKLDSVDNLIRRIKPDIIVNFAGETDVVNPWGDITKTFKQNFTIPSNILTSIVKNNRDIFFFQSSSSLMYGRTEKTIINESDKFDPMYPYGISKLCSHNLLNEFRKTYNIKGSSGIFFNHESYHRSCKFVSKKLSTLISSILNGESKKIKLYDLNYNRDISHAEDFMMGVKLIIENKINDDFIFSSGKSTNILKFCERFFSLYNLNFNEYIDYTDSETYLNDYNIIGDNSKLKSIGWNPKYEIDELIKDMVLKEMTI